MPYSKRIQTLCGLLEKTDVFADVGCDHGYCTQYALQNGLCNHAIFSDISAGSLDKAKKLLSAFVSEGKATAVLGGGFYGVDKEVGQVLIAGMGGCEIVKILSDKSHGFLPKKFVFQPMLNADKLRRWIVENGGVITRDFTFFAEGKYYDVVCGRKALEGETERYTDLEYEFGRDNLKERGKDFLSRIEKLLKDVEKFLAVETLSRESREELQARKKRLEEVLGCEE